MRATPLSETVCARSSPLMLALISVGAAALTAACARASFHLPFTPVPITLQVFAVLLTGLVLGSRMGAASQMLYVAAGAAGLPVFADGRATDAIVGPTGGYIVGFVGAAFVAGLVAECLKARLAVGATLGAATGVAVIYLCGTSWLAVWLAAADGPAVVRETITSAWLLGALPFLGVDCLKALAAASVAIGARRIAPPTA